MLVSCKLPKNSITTSSEAYPGTSTPNTAGRTAMAIA